MKNGSIAVVKKLPELAEHAKKYVKWLPVDDEKTPYVLRDGEEDIDGVFIYRFEEGFIGTNPFTGSEFGIPSDFLVELLPPEEQVNVEELLEADLITV